MAKIIMLCGKLCSGKSTYAARLKNELNAVILSVDELMITLLGKETGEMHDEYVRRSKDYLFRKAAEIVNSGSDVILDQGFWSHSERENAKSFFSSQNVKCELHYLYISDDEWSRRIEKRNAEVLDGRSDAYFVDDGLKAKFISMFEAPDEDETDIIVEV
ncbi:MAG: ATP-binding protein [Ruminococcus sp.]|nr:ATP-binding protein [Ruminococcus sp.]